MLEMLKSLNDNDGLTLKKFNSISYKTGYQVADYGVECTTIEEAMIAINNFNGNCGIWYSNKVYYIDHSIRIKTKRDAIAMGKKYNQISILKWADMSLIYC